MKLKGLLLLVVPVLAYGQPLSKSSELTERVSRMARIGSVTAPSSRRTVGG
jgi:hypothetical protein